MTKNVILCGGDRESFGWIEEFTRKHDCFWIPDSETIWEDDISNYINDSRNKIVLVNVFQMSNYQHNEKLDYSWADLVIGYTPEILDNIPDPINFLRSKCNNQNVIILCGGKHINQLDNPRIYDFLHIPFDSVIVCNSDYAVEPIPNSKPFLFEALLGQGVHNRPWIVNKFKSTGLDSQSLISIIGSNPYRSPALAELDHNEISNIWHQHADKNINSANISSLKRFFDRDFAANVSIPEKVYQNSWFSIVSETSPVATFLTEKTGKCLLAGRVFVLFSTQGILSKLRSIGFKTFHDFIDESYDNINDDKERWTAAWKVVEYLSTVDPVKLYNNVWPIIEHNHIQFKKFQERNLEVRKFVSKFL